MLSANWRDLLSFNPVAGSHTKETPAVPLPVPDGANKILLQADGADIKFSLDGTDPTTDGFTLIVDQPMIIGIQSNTVLKIVGAAIYEWGI